MSEPHVWCLHATLDLQPHAVFFTCNCLLCVCVFFPLMKCLAATCRQNRPKHMRRHTGPQTILLYHSASIHYYLKKYVTFVMKPLIGPVGMRCAVQWSRSSSPICSSDVFLQGRTACFSTDIDSPSHNITVCDMHQADGCLSVRLSSVMSRCVVFYGFSLGPVDVFLLVEFCSLETVRCHIQDAQSPDDMLKYTQYMLMMCYMFSSLLWKK